MTWTKTRSEIANAKKSNPDADVTELRRKLREERLAAHIAEWLEGEPHLTPDQLDRIAGLLQEGVRK